MGVIFRGLLLLLVLLGACSVPSFSVGPDVSADPCAIQKATGQLCGGACPACADGESCAAAADCASNLCDSGVCTAAPTCTDGVTNGTETDLDCGGGCAPCPLDERCTHDADCSSGLCMEAKCATPAPADPSCSDGQKNASESDIDCGGSCSPCGVNKRCATGSDCETLVCASVCQPAGCADGVRNGAESDTDCGGSCAGCALKLVCNANADCASGSCVSGHCIASNCADKLRNGDETGIDCGGSCAACAASQGCSKATDCQSMVCSASKVCSAASCTDGVLNGSESEIDCGTGCGGCQNGQHCKVAGDCASGLCNQTYCVPSAPTGGVLVSTGWLATASDTAGNSSTAQAVDGKPSTRWTSGAYQVPGMWFEVDMLKSQIMWGVTVDVSTSPGDAPALFDIYLSTDGTFKSASLQSVTCNAGGICQGMFSTAHVARYVKLVLTNNKASNWWSIGELTVSK